MMEKLRVLLASVVLFTMLAPVSAFSVSAAASSVLSGKSALFVGDSIMAGWRDSIDGQDYANGRGWGYRIRETYGMTVDIVAQAGQAMSTVRDGYMNPIYKQLEKNKYKNYDYIILEGGFNDIMGNERSTAKETAPLGTMSDSYDIASFDRSTFASGLEHLLCYATTTFPNAKIGFIITFETPYSSRGNGTNDGANTKKYFDLAKRICDKWNVPYLDFYNGTTADGTKYFDIFYPDGRTLLAQYPNGLPSSKYGTLQNIKDDIHPNKAGYDASYGYIAQWMMTLPVYAPPRGVTVARTTTTTSSVTTTTRSTTVVESNSTKTATHTTSVVTTLENTTTQRKPTESKNGHHAVADGSSTTTAAERTDKTSHVTDEKSEETNTANGTADSAQKETDYTWLVVTLITVSVAMIAAVIVTVLHFRK